MSIPQVPLTPLQVVFTLTDGRLPFRTDGTGNEQLPGLLETIPKPLLVRLARWNPETAAAYDWEAGEFGSKTRPPRSSTRVRIVGRTALVTPPRCETGDVVVWDRLPGDQGDEQWVAVNPDGVLFRGPLSPLEQQRELSGIMDRDDTPERGFIEFTANYTVWPFNENITADHPDADYAERIPSDLKERLLRWGTFFVDHHGLTGFAADRLLGEFDEEYLRLAEELALLGFRFKLSQWWSR